MNVPGFFSLASPMGILEQPGCEGWHKWLMVRFYIPNAKRTIINSQFCSGNLWELLNSLLTRKYLAAGAGIWCCFGSPPELDRWHWRCGHHTLWIQDTENWAGSDCLLVVFIVLEVLCRLSEGPSVILPNCRPCILHYWTAWGWPTTSVLDFKVYSMEEIHAWHCTLIKSLWLRGSPAIMWNLLLVFYQMDMYINCLQIFMCLLKDHYSSQFLSQKPLWQLAVVKMGTRKVLRMSDSWVLGPKQDSYVALSQTQQTFWRGSGRTGKEHTVDTSSGCELVTEIMNTQ